MIAAMQDHPDLNAAIVAKGERREKLWAGIADYRINQMLPIVHRWRDALTADGWAIQPTYSHEPIEHAWRAEKEGFVILGLARPIPGSRGEVHKPDICAWGPDGGAIDLPDEYDFSRIKAAMSKCGECGKEGVETKRYAFANRCCNECGLKFMAALPSNWAD